MFLALLELIISFLFYRHKIWACIVVFQNGRWKMMSLNREKEYGSACILSTDGVVRLLVVLWLYLKQIVILNFLSFVWKKTWMKVHDGTGNCFIT